MKTVTCVDSGIGNKAGLTRFIENFGYRVILTKEPNEIEKAKKIVFFGVGSFDGCMKSIRRVNGLEESLKKQVLEQIVPVLGICLGMQILFQTSTEGNEKGLGILDGTVRKLQYKNGYPIPHIGWNTVNQVKNSCLLEKISFDKEFYFSHSYVVDEIDEFTVGATEYGEEFTSVIQSGNIFGCQFHPEKSYQSGEKFMTNFLEL